MKPGARFSKAIRGRVPAFVLLAIGLVLLTGCLEAYETTRLPSGALSNFFLHLQNGELDDARAYVAPGLVTPTTALDLSIKSASDRVRRYEFRNVKYNGKDLANGDRQESISGEFRPRAASGQPTPGPDAGWQKGDVLSALMVFRGPGWRILTFDLQCCK